MIDPASPDYLAGHRMGQRAAYARVLAALDRQLALGAGGRVEACDVDILPQLPRTASRGIPGAHAPGSCFNSDCTACRSKR